MMKTLEVKEEHFADDTARIEDISARLDKLGPGYRIDTVNWPEYRYMPDVSFNIAYGRKEIFLKYCVEEEHFKAEMTETNQKVYEDSCVEFFVSPASDGLYYNFEFNAIGTCLLGSGRGRTDSIRASAEVVAAIRRLTTAGTKPLKEKTGNFKWAITLAIPFDVFFLHKIDIIKGRTFGANFYKCGDKLSVPHYLTWNPVETAAPDFHRPEYFGQLRFL